MSGYFGAKKLPKARAAHQELALQPTSAHSFKTQGSILNLQNSIGNRAASSLLHVRVHMDATASRLTNEHRALGLASGTDVYLAPAIKAQSFLGQHVLTHELAHVLQQVSGQEPGTSFATTQQLESEANAVADAPNSAVVSSAAAPGSVQKADQLPPGFVDERLIPELKADKNGWKKYVDVAWIAEVIREN